VDGLWATKSEGVGLIVRAISFQDFQPDVITIHQSHRPWYSHPLHVYCITGTAYRALCCYINYWQETECVLKVWMKAGFEVEKCMDGTFSNPLHLLSPPFLSSLLPVIFTHFVIFSTQLFFLKTFKALNGLWCAEMPLRNYSLTHPFLLKTEMSATKVHRN